jgi:hypothetical protein
MPETEDVEKPEKADDKETEAEEKRHAKIARQVQNEFQVGEDAIRSWPEKKRVQLKLYINQRRDPKKVGDTR